ncbi:MAG: phosphatase PAP2 family protein [Candidatus Kapabacteria bacterium]|nr:phosphatase PAP2 family protein [Candidatus Kapabacteria bacterium]
MAADVLTRFDDDARTALQRQRSSQNDGVMRLADAYGETKYALAAGGLLYIGGIAIGEERVRTTGRLAFESLLVSGVITTSLKYVLGRARPFLDEGQGSFTPFPGLRNDSRFSLPSGHTTVAFTLSTVLAKRINNTYASIGLYSAAGLTGLARMYYDKHWLTDVLAGAAVGYLSATWILNIHESNSVQSQAQSQSSFRCFLSPTPGGVSFTAIW